MKTKNTFAIYCFAFGIFAFYSTNGFGQLKDTVIQMVNSFHPTIANANKIYNEPVVKDSIPPSPNLKYSILTKKVSTPFTVAPIKPAKMVGEPLAKLYNTLVKLGAGNYNTPYFELFNSNGRSKEYDYGVHLKHLSSKADMAGYGFGGYSDNQAGLYGKKFFRKHTLTGNIDYSRNLVHYYGYDTAMIHHPDNNSIKQWYSNIGSDFSLQSHYTDSVRLNYLLKLKYYNLQDFYGTMENNLNAQADFSGFYEKQLIHIPVSVNYFNNRSKIDTSNSVLIGLNPYILSSGEKWRSRIGVGVAIEGKQNDKSRFYFYPNLDFSYDVIENIIVPYAGIGGGIEENTLKSLTAENPFLIPNPERKNTNNKYELYGGLRGSISKTVSYNARTSYRKAEDMYFFVNGNSDSLKKGFSVVYDNASIFNVHGELQFQYSEKIKLMAKGDYNKYTLENELRPWHRPNMQLTFSANYNLKDKIVAGADVFVIGNRFSYTPVQGLGPNIAVVSTSIHELKPIIDGNLSLEYRYSKKLSGFIHFNNLGFARYYIWNNYPSYKFNFLLGITVAM